jgi:hypothetical protein
VGNINYAATSDTSKLLTEMMVDDAPLSDMDVNYAGPSDSPVYVGSIQSCNSDKTMHDVSLEINNEVEDPIYIASPISTQTLAGNNHILDIDGTPKACNKEVKKKKIQLVEHDAIFRSEMNSMFKIARYRSEESREIIRCAKKTSLTEVLLPFTLHIIHRLSPSFYLGWSTKTWWRLSKHIYG